MFSFRSARPAKNRKETERSACRTQTNYRGRFEQLEQRTLMSVTPIAGPVKTTTVPVGPNFNAARVIDLQSMPIQQLFDSLASKNATDFFRVSLQQGEFLAIDIDPSTAAGGLA